jgi:hypothetical protein
MKNSLLLISSLFCSALAFGCADEKGDTGANTTKATATNPTSDATSNSGSDTSATASATDGGTSGVDPTAPGTTSDATGPGSSSDSPTCGAFICETDTPVVGECDVFLQDCKDGEKCAAVITDGGGAWNSSKCVPVSGSDVPGDACTAESTADGLDSCAKGAMCWGVDMDGNGTCVELCMGTPDAPTCPNSGMCTIANDGFLNLCLPNCDPLLQDCAEGAACYPINDGFTCAPDASGDTGKANDPCEFINVCEAGLLCAGPEFVGAGCPAGSMGCCTPFCEFPDGVCPNPDQSCVQWFDPAMLPEGDPQLAIGYCGVPQ